MPDVRSLVSSAVVYFEAIVTTNNLRGLYVLKFSPFIHTSV